MKEQAYKIVLTVWTAMAGVLLGAGMGLVIMNGSWFVLGQAALMLIIARGLAVLEPAFRQTQKSIAESREEHDGLQHKVDQAWSQVEVVSEQAQKWRVERDYWKKLYYGREDRVKELLLEVGQNRGAKAERGWYASRMLKARNLVRRNAQHRDCSMTGAGNKWEVCSCYKREVDRLLTPEPLYGPPPLLTVKMGPEEISEFKKRFRKEMMGNLERSFIVSTEATDEELRLTGIWGRPCVLPGGMKIETIEIPPPPAEFAEFIDGVNSRIASGFMNPSAMTLEVPAAEGLKSVRVYQETGEGYELRSEHPVKGWKDA